MSQSGGKSTHAQGKSKPSGNISASRSGLVFPPSRFRRYLKKGRFAERVGQGAPIFTAAVLEYLVAEVTELAGNAALDNKKSRITPRHIQLAIRHDEELNRLMQGVTISQGGVLPQIQAELLPAFKVQKKKEAELRKKQKAGIAVSNDDDADAGNNEDSTNY
ncbi:hypothetical protein JCM3766R1_001979 [Sporobolomyces carnicolor]